MKPRSRARLAPLLSLLLLGAACSGNKYGVRTQTWGEAGDSDYDDAREDKQAEERKLTAREYAARFNTSAECEMEARRIETMNKPSGVALFHACLDRDDFRELEPFYTAPWRSLLANPKAMVDLGRIIAKRGGWLVEDLAYLQQQDVDVLFLSQALEQPEQARGKVLITRIRFLEPRKDVPGQLVFEEVTLSPEDDLGEEEDVPGDVRFPSALTGQRVLLELPGQKEPLRPGDELIVVGELLGVEPVLNKEVLEEQDWAVIRVLGHFTPEDRVRG